LIEHIGERQAILMSTSGGADVALLAAINFPDRVRAVIADSSVEPLSSRPVESWSPNAPDAMGRISFWKTSTRRRLASGGRSRQPMLLRFSEGGGDFFGGRLSAIRCPVLLTASLADEMLPGVAINSRPWRAIFPTAGYTCSTRVITP
jgi:pimeloyl-ACP methyl ester carboxylesterase